MSSSSSKFIIQNVYLHLLLLTWAGESFRHSTWSPIRTSNRYRRYTHPWAVDTFKANAVPGVSQEPIVEKVVNGDSTHQNRGSIDPATYYADWHRFLDGSSGQRCYDIPRNMSLCQNLEYSRMILPNFLQHEDLKEAVDQSQVWVSLARTQCHPELSKFLCALYAPICVEEFQERLIHPCSELCEDVKKSCLPTMLQFGFRWPDIVKCSQFPLSSSKMCVQMSPKKDQKCSGCEKGPPSRDVLNAYCKANIVFKARLLYVARSNSTKRKDYTLRFDRQVKVFKSDASPSNLRQAVFDVSCQCDQLERYLERENRRMGKWLIMGKLGKNGRFQVSYLSRFRKRNTGLRDAIRSIKSDGEKVCKGKNEPRDNQKKNKLELHSSVQGRIGYLNDQARRNMGDSFGVRQLSLAPQRSYRSLNRRQRSPRRPLRRSLVRRSQKYETYPSFSSTKNPSWKKDSFTSMAGSWPQSPIASNHAHTIYINYTDKLDKLPFLESERDLFSPNDLRPWLR